MKEETILANLGRKEKGLVATQLGIEVSTLDVHLTRVRRKREECLAYLKKTDLYKKELYPRRKGE
jgi:hypothetical protein